MLMSGKRVESDPASGPDLSLETLRRVDVLFPSEDRKRAKALLYEHCGNNLPFLGKADMYELDRFRFAVLKYSDGNFSMLEDAVKLAQVDWRDLLTATGFAHDVEAPEDGNPNRWASLLKSIPCCFSPVSTTASRRCLSLWGSSGRRTSGAAVAKYPRACAYTRV